MPTTKKPTRRPGAKKISKLTDPQRRTLLRQFKALEVRASAIKNSGLTPAAKKQLQKEVDAIVRRIRRASNVMSFA